MRFSRASGRTPIAHRHPPVVRWCRSSWCREAGAGSGGAGPDTSQGEATRRPSGIPGLLEPAKQRIQLQRPRHPPAALHLGSGRLRLHHQNRLAPPAAGGRSRSRPSDPSRSWSRARTEWRRSRSALRMYPYSTLRESALLERERPDGHAEQLGCPGLHATGGLERLAIRWRSSWRTSSIRGRKRPLVGLGAQPLDGGVRTTIPGRQVRARPRPRSPPDAPRPRLHPVLDLAHVAWPRVRAQGRHGGGGQVQRRVVVGIARLGEKGICQQGKFPRAVSSDLRVLAAHR